MEVSAAPASRLLSMDLNGQIQSPRLRNDSIPVAAAQKSEIDDVFDALDEIMSRDKTTQHSSPSSDTFAHKGARPPVNHSSAVRDNSERESSTCQMRTSCTQGYPYAPAAAAALRGSLSKGHCSTKILQRRPSDASVSSVASTAPSDDESLDFEHASEPRNKHSLRLQLPAPPRHASDAPQGDVVGGSGHDIDHLDSARTGVSDVLNSAGTCYTEMSQMVTPRAQQQPGSGGSNNGPAQKSTELTEDAGTSTVDRLCAAADQPLGQIDEDTEAELEMLREQQEMIEQLCKIKAEAFLAKEKEKYEEKKREREQMHLMRLEQLQLMRLQEARREHVRDRRPTTAPVKRHTRARGVGGAGTRACDDDDVLNMSGSTETLSPGVRPRAAAMHSDEHSDQPAWTDWREPPARRVYTPQKPLEAASGCHQDSATPRGRRPCSAEAGREDASAAVGQARLAARPKSALSRLVSSLTGGNLRRFRAPVAPIQLPRSLRSRLSKSSKVSWSSHGIPIVPNRDDSEDEV